MKINGKFLEEYLNSLDHVSLASRDNNDYLISYKFDTGSEIAFDPRPSGKASIFVDKLPEKLCSGPGIGEIVNYPPINPSTALRRVSKHLAEKPQLYKVQILTFEALERFIEWIRWA